MGARGLCAESHQAVAGKVKIRKRIYEKETHATGDQAGNTERSTGRENAKTHEVGSLEIRSAQAGAACQGAERSGRTGAGSLGERHCTGNTEYHFDSQVHNRDDEDRLL